MTAKSLQSSNWSCVHLCSRRATAQLIASTQDPHQNLFGAHGLTSTHVLLIESLNTCNLSEECFLLHYWCSSLYNGKSASRISLPKLRSSGENFDLSIYLFTLYICGSSTQIKKTNKTRSIKLSVDAL